MPTRPYIFYDQVNGLCSQCLRKCEGKIVFQDDAVYMLKRCRTHGHERVLIADDIAYYKKSREQFLKPPDVPLHFNTPILHGFRRFTPQGQSIRRRDPDQWVQPLPFTTPTT